MKNKIVALVIALIMAAVTVPNAMATGNGAESGAHYNLNIIGVDKEKQGNFADLYNHDSGKRIFVKLWGDTKIWLNPGETFDVIDPDGTDGSASLQLIDPYPGTVTTSTYKIYVRALGKPGPWANMTSGFVDEFGNYWYSLETITLTHEAGKPPKFSDKTLELTTIYVDITNDGIDNPVRYKLFDNELWDYFWDYDNHGLKLVQLRFYLQ